MKHRGVLPFLLTSLAVLLAAFPLQAAQLNTSSTLTDTQPANNVPSGETQFTPAIDDLPLMPGLEPVPNEDMVFTVPRSGRIAQSSAEGAVDVDDVYRFYRRTLPQLGWHMIDTRHYMREGEHLHIDAHADGKETTVRFSVNPR